MDWLGNGTLYWGMLDGRRTCFLVSVYCLRFFIDVNRTSVCGFSRRSKVRIKAGVGIPGLLTGVLVNRRFLN